MSLPTSNIPFEGLAKFNDGFYRVTISTVFLSDNDPIEWDYMTLFEEFKKQYEAIQYQIITEKVK